MNRLFYGDNITIMQTMPSNSVDLIYLDPPFNSNKNYNLMYRNLTGKPVPEQVEAFCDTWTLDAEKEETARKIPVLMLEQGIDGFYVDFWNLWLDALRKTNSRLLAYLVYMVERLLYMKRLLKSTGSIYLHCDPTASHYIKVMMDGVFGHDNFRNEIIWKRTSAHSDARKGLGALHDVLLFYSASKKFTWNPIYQKYDDAYVKRRYKHQDPDGRLWMDDNLSAKGLSGGGYNYEYKGVSNLWRVPLQKMKELEKSNKLYYTRTGGIRIKRYLDEMKGTPVGDVWADIAPINSQARDRLGYPTQKPVALLKRIIEASSNEGDVVFDPFCGCGTTIYAAQETGREWVGCDIAILAIGLVRDVLHDRYHIHDSAYRIDGIPVGVEQAKHLFKQSPFQFQHWFVERVRGFPTTKKTADRGVDGRIYFDTNSGLREMVISVKGGRIHPCDIRDLRGVLEREKNAEMAGFLSIQQPTRQMREEAAQAGMYEYNGNSYPKIQFLTVEDVLEHKRVFDMPTLVRRRVDQGQQVLPFA